MSYILDALRKAETERALNRVSCIASPQQCHTRPKLGWVRRLIYVALVVVGTLSLTWLWARYEVAAEAQASTPANSDANVMARTEGQPSSLNHPEIIRSSVAPTASSEAWPLPTAEDIDTVTSLPAGKAEETRAMTAPDVEKGAPRTSRVPRPVTKQAAAEVEDNLAEVELKAVTSSSSALRAEDHGKKVAMIETGIEQGLSHPRDEAPVTLPITEIEAATPALPENDNMQTEEPLPPLLSTLPYRFQSTLPKIVINAQAYAEETHARFVIINMKKYQEGQHTETGILVEKIGEDHLVLSYQGQAFRIRR